ncbi:MAG: hypothetical protein HY002_15355 [Candidatus Rokubacteria bacterium]|nr:hypothetical protein [Candidatus Rokubacteria bacterium]
MFGSVDGQVRHELSRYLQGQLSLRALQQWLAPATWGLELSAHPLVADVFLRLAEFGSGDWAESDLREEFERLLAADVSLQAERLYSGPTAQAPSAVVRFLPFGTIQIVAAYPAEQPVEDAELALAPDQVVRGTAVS